MRSMRQMSGPLLSDQTNIERPAPIDDGEAAVIVEELRKSYGEVRAVDGISFEVRRGEVFGLLGPNGAGKTTTVEIIEGMRERDGGEVRVCGFDPLRQAREVKECIGVTLQAAALPDRIKVREALALFGSFYRRRAKIDELIQLVSLEAKADEQFCHLSGGQQQRLAIALALVNDPQVVILDEPTAGLDPQARRELHGVIGRLGERGKAIILTTHYIEEAEQLCHRVAIIDHGRIIALDAPRSIIAARKGRARIEFSAAVPIEPVELRRVPFIEQVAKLPDGSYSLLAADASRAVVELVKWLDAEGHELVDLRITRPTLEDVFIELTGRRMRA